MNNYVSKFWVNVIRLIFCVGVAKSSSWLTDSFPTLDQPCTKDCVLEKDEPWTKILSVLIKSKNHSFHFHQNQVVTWVSSRERLDRKCEKCHLKMSGRVSPSNSQEEKLDGENRYFCESCQSKQSATRRIKLHSLPPTLNLQLMRFVFDRYAIAQRLETSLSRRTLLRFVFFSFTRECF